MSIVCVQCGGTRRRFVAERAKPGDHGTVQGLCAMCALLPKKAAGPAAFLESVRSRENEGWVFDAAFVQRHGHEERTQRQSEMNMTKTESNETSQNSKAPSEEAKRMVGQTFEYTHRDQPPRRVKVLGVRATGSTIEDTNTGETWPGISFFLEPEGGGRNFWSDTFPDKAGSGAGGN